MPSLSLVKPGGWEGVKVILLTKARTRNKGQKANLHRVLLLDRFLVQSLTNRVELFSTFTESRKLEVTGVKEKQKVLSLFEAEL